MYIFLDESGDLGFDFTKKKTSQFFVITFLFCEDKKQVEKMIKKVFTGFTKSEVKSHAGGVLHAYKENPKTRFKLLGLLSSSEEIKVFCIYLNKRKIYTKLKDEKHVLYNYITNILIDRMYAKKLVSRSEEIIVIASRRETNKFINENFKSYLKSQVLQNHNILDIVINIKSPQEEKGLQAVDMICWALFRKHEHDDDSYYQKIKNLIMEENPLFP